MRQGLGVVVLDLLEENGIDCLETFQDVRHLVMVVDHRAVCSECCSPVDDIIVLLEIEEVVGMNVVVEVFVHFADDNEGHVAVGK